MPAYKSGDHVKVEFTDEVTGESEWMWVRVDSVDDARKLVCGRLDSQPIVSSRLKVGQELAVSYDKVREHQRFQGP